MPSSTRVRYRVVGFMPALGAVTYLDRACIGSLAPDISGDLGLSKEQMSWNLQRLRHRLRGV